MSESKQQPGYAVPDWQQVDSTVYQLVCVKHCNHDTSFMKGNPAHVTENKVWCVHEDEDGFCGHVCATHGELVNRFSFHVQGNNRQLKPGEAERIAAMIIREHNSHEALVDALKRARDWMKEPMGGHLLHERFDGKTECETDCLRCAVSAAISLAEKES